MEIFELPSLKDTVAALKWLSQIMEDRQVPYQIVGGMAAKAYGVQRPLVDIDILVPLQFLETLATEMKEHLIYPPKHHLSERWDMTYMALNYGVQRIEIGDGEGAKIFDTQKNVWRNHSMDYSKTHWINYQGIELPFIPKDQLLRYKKILSRDVDLQDIFELENQNN